MCTQIKSPPAATGRPKTRNITSEIYRNGPLFPMTISSLEQIKHARVMHALAETMIDGYETYFHVIEAFTDATNGEFLRHYLEVNND